NDALQYGTQFYLRENKFAQTLSQGTTSTFANNFPGFALTRGAGLAINALSRLQVGSLVPILTGNAQSTLASGAPIVNNVAYHPIGVIMQVTPHVNSGGL